MSVKTAADLKSAVVSDIVEKDYTTGKDVGNILENILDSSLLEEDRSDISFGESLGIKRESFSPDIPANSRKVHSINYGDVGNPEKAFISFGKFNTIGDVSGAGNLIWSIDSSVDVSEIKRETLTAKAPTLSGIRLGSQNTQNTTPLHPASTLLVFKDHTKTEVYGLSKDEVAYNDQSGTEEEVSEGNYTYADRPNALVGWYSLSPSQSNSLLSLGPKVTLQGAWLEYNNGDTILKLAFYNQDSSDVTTVPKDVGLITW